MLKVFWWPVVWHGRRVENSRIHDKPDQLSHVELYLASQTDPHQISIWLGITWLPNRPLAWHSGQASGYKINENKSVFFSAKLHCGLTWLLWHTHIDCVDNPPLIITYTHCSFYSTTTMCWLSTAIVILATSLVMVSATSGPTQCLAFDVNWTCWHLDMAGRTIMLAPRTHGGHQVVQWTLSCLVTGKCLCWLFSFCTF